MLKSKLLVLFLSTLVFCLGFTARADAPPLPEGEKIKDTPLQTQQIVSIKKPKIKEAEIAESKVSKSKVDYYDIPLSQEIQDYIFKLCQTHDISIPLVISVMDLESEGTFDNELICYNTNGTYDQGVMQLNSRYHSWFGEMIREENFDAANIYHNIHAGIKYLSILKSQYKDKYSGDELKIWFLNSYNCGTTGFKNYVKRTGTISRAYSRVILEKRDFYRRDINDEADNRQ